MGEREKKMFDELEGMDDTSQKMLVELIKDSLHFAAQEGGLEEVKRLLEEGFCVHRFDDLGHTALLYAAQEGHLEVMKTLIDAGADVNAHDESRIGET